MHITALVILISWYILVLLSETSLSLPFSSFLVPSNREVHRTLLIVAFSSVCSSPLFLPTVFRRISLCLCLSFRLSLSLYSSLSLSFERLPTNLGATAEGTGRRYRRPCAPFCRETSSGTVATNIASSSHYSVGNKQDRATISCYCGER